MNFVTKIADKVSARKEKFKSIIAPLSAVVGAATTSIACFAEGESGSSTYINVSNVNFMSILNEMVALVPVILPVVIGCLAFRKGLSFLTGALRGA